eukprot:TRINITY_DN1937_c0_g1_i1.p1 TRINITY_DN1937_c0_g1~~TRINITY_DN1937_c0_g1_i1.p1  ORF type:complete len:177 (-),score=19.12 TRINITY_DN1937_c0_g1_i1:2-532(-)
MDKWENNAKLIEPDIKPAGSLDNYPSVQKIPCYSQTKQLFFRLFKVLSRDPVLFLGRVVFMSIATAFMSFTFWKSREKKQSEITSRMFITFLCAGLPPLFNIIQVYNTSLNLRSVRREVKNGMYSMKAYFLQDTFYIFLYCIVLTFAANGVQGFVIVHHYGPHWCRSSETAKAHRG